MPRTPIWQSIATTLTHEIAGGHYPPGARMPTEAALSSRFGVNRHTVRRALKRMSEDGLVHSRRGAGVFVAMKPMDYAIGRRTRFHQNLAAAGQTPGKKILHLETRQSDTREAEALALPAGADVHAYEGLSLADGQPIAVSRSIFPAAPFPGFLDDLAELGSITAALARHGIADYTRASTRLTAKAATATQALHLRIAENAPLLQAVAINIDTTGMPIEYGHTWFAGERVTLTLSDPALQDAQMS
ncbi:phosphonate metabolism transcriptional regulator PhnF [Algicella marina]|uniref:Phosphonate metabolism transcriptional regulator PhnF n=1 Tax=Algicella marina TaxID=2683284 RepID=A0A6P1T569_9RHOB|nr:phosphonate metabolism transcriptional regulator PhnF [Algicella marina]QHQ35682.1 phosphonate metabolism transcriptional regulator PhnF [Algicella marina]